MQSNKAITQGKPHDPTEITILIEATQSQLAALVSRLHSPAHYMNETYALTQSPTALEEFMTPLPNWNPLPSPVQDTKPPHLLPLPLLPETSWTDFLCLLDIEPSTGHFVYETNAMSTWTGKSATTTPLDLEIFLPLAPSAPPYALSLLTTRSEDKRIDGLSLPPLLMRTDT